MNLTPFVSVVVRQLLPAGLLAIVLMTSSTPAQSLGDVAKQEQARRKSAPSGKVYTNGDLKGAPAPASSSPSAPAPSSSTPSSTTPRTAPDADAKSAPKTDAKSDDKGRPADAKDGTTGDKPKASDPAQDEADWRKRQKTIQDSLDRARSFAEALQSRINGLTAEFAAKDDPAQRTLVGTERQKALTELDRVKKEIDQHTQELTDLQDEARRAGVPPGWLR